MVVFHALLFLTLFYYCHCLVFPYFALSVKYLKIISVYFIHKICVGCAIVIYLLYALVKENLWKLNFSYGFPIVSFTDMIHTVPSFHHIDYHIIMYHQLRIFKSNK